MANLEHHQHLALGEGVLLRPLGDQWAVYAGASQETALLNDLSAAILELLAAGPQSVLDIYTALAADAGTSAVEIERVLLGSWSQLFDLGLVRLIEPASASINPDGVAAERQP